jgi:hypothetical protein
MDSLLTISIGISFVGVLICTDTALRTYRRFRSSPSTTATWSWMASVFAVLAFATLFVTALGARLAISGAYDPEVTTPIAHLSMILRGGLIAIAIALAYGWRKIERER